MLGNKSSGDCTLIKTGNTEVLIDAGSEKSSAATLVPYISEYCTDGVLEYVIVTHADQDHIAAFVGTNSAPGIFESFECGTIIDFPRTNKDTQVYKDYVELRDAEAEAGATPLHSARMLEQRERRRPQLYPVRGDYDEFPLSAFL